MENLSEGHCCHCCDGGKTKSTPSLLALGLGWSLTITEMFRKVGGVRNISEAETQARAQAEVLIT